MSEQNNTSNNQKRPKWQLPFLLLLIVASVFIIKRHQHTPTPFQQSEGMIFGTVFHATYQSDSVLYNDIMQTLGKVDASLSMFNPNSTISRINRGESDESDEMLSTVLTMSQEISKATNGCFDVTVAPLVNAWGFGFKNDALPDSAQIDSLLEFVGWDGVTLDNGKIRKRDERMIMDFSAVAKGFGVDQVASLLRSRGIKNFMVEIGGEIVVSGNNPKGNPWSIGVNKPIEDSTSTDKSVQTILHLTDCGMATSGNYRNFYFSSDGRKLAHTIDPHTGYPVQHSILSSTVIAPTCAMADAFATSFMVMGLDSAKVILAKHPELKAYFIYSDENKELKTWSSEGLKEMSEK